MTTQKSVNIALIAYMESHRGSYPVVYGNVDDADLANGQATYLKMSVTFRKDKQHQLGDVNSRRIDGEVLIIINVRKGVGDADRDDAYDAVVKSFRSQVIGGATLLDPELLAKGNTENWSLTAWKIPFYFYDS